MTKSEAIALFGDTKADGIKAIAAALDIERAAIYQWPDNLPSRLADEITGAAMRTGKLKAGKPNGKKRK